MANKAKFDINRVAKTSFFISIVFFSFLYGTLVGKYQFFPYKFFMKSQEGLEWALNAANISHPWFYFDDKFAGVPQVKNSAQAWQGLNLITRVKSSQRLAVEIRDMDCKIVHSWDVDWFDNWPDPTHLTPEELPRARPGTSVHGITINENGDILFNFTELGLVKMDIDGNILWRLPMKTHHRVFTAYNGDIWVGAYDRERNVNELYPSMLAVDDPMIIKIDQDGNVLRKIHMIDLMENNNLRGLVYSASRSIRPVGYVNGVIFHLNDVEIFPDTMEEGFFKKGDIMVSMRDINTILVFDPDTLKIKWRVTGSINRQHDPDFIDGNTISVLDNNPHLYTGNRLESLIVKIMAPAGTQNVIFPPKNTHQPFYTGIMGEHQWLLNGNLLLTQSMAGRAIEVNPAGEIVWEYRNYINKETGAMAIITDCQRLPMDYLEVFSKKN